MSRHLTLGQMAAVLNRIVDIAWSIHEGQMDPFGRLTSADRQEVAWDILEATSASGFIHLDDAAAAILIWHCNEVGYWFEVVHLWNKYGRTIATVHEYFKRQGLMERMSPASYQ